MLSGIDKVIKGDRPKYLQYGIASLHAMSDLKGITFNEAKEYFKST